MVELQMSDGSCSGPFRIHDNQYLDNYSPLESTKFELSANTPTMENIKNPKDIVITAADVVIVVAAVDGGAKQVDATNNEIQDPFTKRKRKKTSGVWEHFRLVKLYDETELSNIVSSTEAGGSQGVSAGGTSKSGFSSLTNRFGKGIKTDTTKYDQHIRSVDTFASTKLELDTYLKEFTVQNEDIVSIELP
ncbi:hypothetical protein V6N13_124404 [Hibiscus sabdariffa]